MKRRELPNATQVRITTDVNSMGQASKSCSKDLFIFIVFFILSWHADLKEELIKALEEKLMAGE